ILGGFGGFGMSDPDARDVNAYPTVLSGDIGIVGENFDNSFHVVVGDGTDATAVLDGFTVTGGNADGNGNDVNGGGIASYGGPTISDCTFKENFGYYGGAMF